jgi:FMN reductase
MSLIVTIGGSPSGPSKSASILEIARHRLEQGGFATHAIAVRNLNTEDLIYGRYNSPELQSTFEIVRQADGVIVATPIYKAAYSGVLKVYLDLLPANAFANKIVLPIATGGSPAHSLVIDYALRPVLVALGAPHILTGVYLIDSEMKPSEANADPGALQLEASAEARLFGAVDELARRLTSHYAD